MNSDQTDFQASVQRAGIVGPYLLGPYRVTGRQVAGRLGDVFLAEHNETHQRVSLKIFPASLSRERLARLGRETRIALQVDHLHVVKTFQVGRVGEVSFIAFEELTGGTLQERLDRDGRLPFIEACQLIEQAALGLGYLHSLGIIHRDVCPANLWVTEHGLVKILEFGAARDAMSYLDSQDIGRLTMNVLEQPDEQLLGHSDYMPAEQARDPHSANVASDLYCLGATLFHCVTGQVPFPNVDPARQVQQHAEDALPLLVSFVPDVPEALQQVLSKALAKQPQERYWSAEEFAFDLTQVVPPAVLPELEPLSTDFLAWLRDSSAEPSRDIPEVADYPAEHPAFLNYIAK
ncbi:MAG: serine/threonine protein kinase [Planctomycetaceae bacterium]|nr:serine/threonine protein kinase [Planctomycetaceae bacterium]